MKPTAASGVTFSMVVDSFKRPYPITISMILLVFLIPFYIFIGELWIPGRALHVPAIPLDNAIPLKPSWSLIYGSLYVFVILPLCVVRQPEQIRRTVSAYLMIWIIAYAIFLLYPTVAPHAAKIHEQNFYAWLLGSIIYSCDVPYNCFPSLHVAHSFVSALTCYRVHRGVGIAAVFWAFLIGISTLYTKQHYILDVIAGIFLAFIAYLIFLRSYPRDAIPEIDRRLAPVLSLGFIAVHALIVFGFWVAYMMTAKV
jgi:membrane-associated phospholipid phosphatase